MLGGQNLQEVTWVTPTTGGTRARRDSLTSCHHGLPWASGLPDTSSAPGSRFPHVGTRRGGGRPPAVLSHRYAGSQSPWLSGTHPARLWGALRCSALVPPLSPPGFGCSSQKLTDFTITLGPGSAAGGPTTATSASRPSRPQSLRGGRSWGRLLIFSARKPGALGWGTLALCSSLLALQLWPSGGRSCHALLCLLGCPRLQPHLSIPTQSSNSESWGAEAV